MSKQTAGSSRSEAQRIGATLRAIREIRGMTVEQLATRELGIAPSHLRNIENGRRSLTAEHLAKAAKVLDVPQIALVREGYFDREAAEREAEVRRLTKDLADKVALVDSLTRELTELRASFEELQRSTKAVA